MVYIILFFILYMASPIWRPCLANLSTLPRHIVYPGLPICRPGDPTSWRHLDSYRSEVFELGEGPRNSPFRHSEVLRCLLVGFVVRAVGIRVAVNLCPQNLLMSEQISEVDVRRYPDASKLAFTHLRRLLSGFALSFVVSASG